VNFDAAYPFVNPARARLSTMKLDGKRYVAQGADTAEASGQNTVFLTTGVVTDCALVTPTASWVSRTGQEGPLVKRIRLRPFAMEYERTAAFLGNFLDIGKSKVYVGPIYHTGLAFATHKNAHQGILFCLIYLRFCLCASGVKTGVGKHFLANMPSQRAPVLQQSVNPPPRPMGNLYPESLEIADDSWPFVLDDTAADINMQYPSMMPRMLSSLISRQSSCSDSKTCHAGMACTQQAMI
jgi:hypothetical protein